MHGMIIIVNITQTHTQRSHTLAGRKVTFFVRSRAHKIVNIVIINKSTRMANKLNVSLKYRASIVEIKMSKEKKVFR